MDYKPATPEEMAEWEKDVLQIVSFLLAAKSQVPLEDKLLLRLIATMRERDKRITRLENALEDVLTEAWQPALWDSPIQPIRNIVIEALKEQAHL